MQIDYYDYQSLISSFTAEKGKFGALAPPNGQISDVAPAKSPIWRRGANQIAKLAILYQDYH